MQLTVKSQLLLIPNSRPAYSTMTTIPDNNYYHGSLPPPTLINKGLSISGTRSVFDSPH